jgi:hypothetical protein
MATLPDTVKRLAETGLIIPDNGNYLEFSFREDLHSSVYQCVGLPSLLLSAWTTFEGEHHANLHSGTSRYGAFP